MDGFKINYYLKKVQRDNTYHYILISVIWDNNIYRTTINTPVDVKLWDKKKQRVKLSASNPKKINDKLDEFRFRLEKYYDEIRLEKKRIPTKKEVKELIEAVLKDKPIRKKKEIPAEKTKTFLEYFKQFIQDSKDGTRVSTNGKRIQDSTNESYSSTYNHLEEFLNSSKFDYSFATIDEKFQSELIKYMAKKKLSNNTQSKIIKILKTFLHYMSQVGYNTNLKFINTMKKFNSETTIVALSKEELESIETLPGLTVKQNKVRDLFLIQTYTGLRLSDLFNLKPENINFKERIITINMLKTQENLIVPISNKLEALLKKYNCSLPKISSQKYNDYLKEISKLASINTPVEKIIFIGNKRVAETLPKYELVSSHTARRTFITLTLKKGVLPEMVMKISGHKNRNSFQSYVRITQEEAVKKVQQAWED